MKFYNYMTNNLDKTKTGKIQTFNGQFGATAAVTPQTINVCIP